MSRKGKPPEEFANADRGLLRKDRIERLSILKKDSKGFASRVFQDDSIQYIAGRFKSNVLRPVLSCADFLKIRQMLLTNKTKVVQARLCKKHLLCPFCAHLRASKLIQKYVKIYKNIVGNQKSYHIVFTVKDGSDLKERFNHLNTSIRSYLADRRKKAGELSKLTSGIYSYEIIKGKNSNEWHPHLHMIALTSEFIDFSRLRAEWKQITGDSFEVHVEEFYGNETEKTLLKPFLEVFKYSLKHSELSDSERLAAYPILFGRKLTNSFGQFRGFQEPESLLDEVSKDDMFWVEIIMKYRDSSGYSPTSFIEFSKEFKSIFKLQEAYKKHGEMVINQFFNPLGFDLIMERTGIDFRAGIIEMIRNNIKGEEEIRNLLLKCSKGGEQEFNTRIAGGEELPELSNPVPEAETDIQDWISEKLYNETDEKEGL